MLFNSIRDLFQLINNKYDNTEKRSDCCPWKKIQFQKKVYRKYFKKQQKKSNAISIIYGYVIWLPNIQSAKRKRLQSKKKGETKKKKNYNNEATSEEKTNAST